MSVEGKEQKDIQMNHLQEIDEIQEGKDFQDEKLGLGVAAS